MIRLPLVALLCLGLAACGNSELQRAIEIGPAAFVPRDLPAILAVEREAAENEALLKLLSP